MIVASRLSAGLDIGGFVVRGNFVGPDYSANMPGRHRIAGFEITVVPDDVWERWDARRSFEERGVVFGSTDEHALTEWCWRNAHPHGHAHGASHGGSTAPLGAGTR